jgi:hypothetical protein
MALGNAQGYLWGMRCFAQIKDGSGNVWVRWEDEVAQEGDLPLLVSATINMFRKEFPAQPLLLADGSFTIEWGKACAQGS